MEDWQLVETLGLSGLTENTIAEAKVGDRRVGLLKREGTVFAFSPTCPHAGTRLCTGWVDARGDVVCPSHGFRFSPKNGLNRSGEGYRLKTFPVKVDGERIFVVVPQM
jgi:nitrite reductase/ring-hydroxylating ferredoxin subunit